MVTLIHSIRDTHQLAIGLVAKCNLFFAIMAPYKQEERIRILQAYLRTMSISETQRDYCIHFKTRISPTKNAIKSLVRNFQETGAVHDAKKMERPKLIRTEVQINWKRWWNHIHSDRGKVPIHDEKLHDSRNWKTGTRPGFLVSPRLGHITQG